MISNIFVIIPAQLVRIAIDYVVESYALFAPLTRGGIGELARDYFLESVFIFGILILVMALLRGFLKPRNGFWEIDFKANPSAKIVANYGL